MIIRVELPAHLRNLARVGQEVSVDVGGRATMGAVIDALETAYPMLVGTIRDQITRQRRPYLRFYACEEDLSHATPETLLPDAVIKGKEPFLVIGAMSGG